jgi:hypothetical protein
MHNQRQRNLALNRLMAEQGYTREALAEAVNATAEQLTGVQIRTSTSIGREDLCRHAAATR